MPLNKMKELEKHINQLKKKGIPITIATLAEVVNMTGDAYYYRFLQDEEANTYFKTEANQQKEEQLMKTLKDYVKTLIKEKKAITYENIAQLHGVSASRAKIIFKKPIFKDYINSAKQDNKILSANEEFKKFYFKYEPFEEFKNMKASEIFNKYGKGYFETVQLFNVFCKHYNVPFLRVNKSKSEE